jgi:ketosteroid isomerase-like protein
VSRDNIEIVRRVVAALNGRDLDAYLACCTGDVELHLPVVGGIYTGPDGIRRWFADLEDSGPDFHVELGDVEAVGGDRVIAFFHVASTGRASGVPVTLETANVYDLIDGRINRIRILLDAQEARRAVGLQE